MNLWKKHILGTPTGSTKSMLISFETSFKVIRNLERLKSAIVVNSMMLHTSLAAFLYYVFHAI